MASPEIATIVEGHGEEAALRPLIYHIIASNSGLIYPTVRPPYREPWGSLVNKPGDLERCAEIVLREGGPSSRLLVLLDADGRCPAELGPRLLERLTHRFSDRLVSVTVADWEYESWFIASAESIGEFVGTATAVEVPDKIEEIVDPKKWLEENILKRRYKETSDQASFSTRINVPIARQRSLSFNVSASNWSGYCPHEGRESRCFLKDAVGPGWEE